MKAIVEQLQKGRLSHVEMVEMDFPVVIRDGMISVDVKPEEKLELKFGAVHTRQEMFEATYNAMSELFFAFKVSKELGIKFHKEWFDKKFPI